MFLPMFKSLLPSQFQPPADVFLEAAVRAQLLHSLYPHGQPGLVSGLLALARSGPAAVDISGVKQQISYFSPLFSSLLLSSHCLLLSSLPLPSFK